MIEVELIGSDRARAFGLEVKGRSGKGPLGPLLRLAIERGLTTADRGPVRVMRSGALSLTASTVSAFTDYDVAEPKSAPGIVRRKYLPFEL